MISSGRTNRSVSVSAADGSCGDKHDRCATWAAIKSTRRNTGSTQKGQISKRGHTAISGTRIQRRDAADERRSGNGRWCSRAILLVSCTLATGGAAGGQAAAGMPSSDELARCTVVEALDWSRCRLIAAKAHQDPAHGTAEPLPARRPGGMAPTTSHGLSYNALGSATAGRRRVPKRARHPGSPDAEQ